MRRPLFLISAAWLIHATAWFLPVVTGIKGGSIDALPGWMAFVAALRGAWPSESIFDSWYVNLFAFVSVLTTIFFVIGSPWVMLRGSSSSRRTAGWAAATAFVVNAHWYFLRGDDSWVSGLGVGYFLWWFSFALLAIGLLYLAGRKGDAGSKQSEAALLPDS